MKSLIYRISHKLKLDDTTPLTRGDVVYYLFLSSVLVMVITFMAIFISKTYISKRMNESITSTAETIYSFLVNATEEEYDDVAQEIRHSILRLSFDGTEQDLLDALPNTCEVCPLDRAHPGQVYLVALNTDELYRLDVYGKYQSEQQSFGYSVYGGGYDEISRSLITIKTNLDQRYTDVLLWRYDGLLSYHRVKENFCEDCIHHLVENLETASVGELALFDPTTHQILPITEKADYQVGDYTITVHRDLSNTTWFNSYILRLTYSA